MAKTKIKGIIICVILFFVAYGLGHSLFPNALNNDNGSFAPIGMAILSGVFLFVGGGMALWKRLLIGAAVPHAFFGFMILLSLSGGYLMGCIMGM